MRKRGFVLMLAIFFIALIEMMALSLALSVPQGVRGMMRYEEETAAGYAAEAGLQDTLAWMESWLETEREPTDPDHRIRVREGQLGDYEWKVTIYPDRLTYPRGNHSCRCYEVLAEAWKADGFHYKRRLAVSQQPFTKYARFNDHWPDPSSVSDGVYYWAGRIQVDGPVHSNEGLWIMAEPSFFAGSEPLGELFQTDQVSCVDQAYYFNGQPTPSQLDALYTRCPDDRRPHILTERIPMPEMGNLKRQAWEGTPQPTGPGLTVRRDGGVYVSGDVLELELRDNGGRAEQRFLLDEGLYVLQENGASTTLRKPDGSVDTVGARNGLIYVEGDILKLHGINVGNHTIAVNPDERSGSKHEIVLGGELRGGRLGLVCYHLSLPPHSVLPRVFASPVRVEAAVYAVGHDGYGGIRVHDMLNPPGVVGQLELRGCLIEGRRRRCADVPNNSGWNVQVDYDEALRDDPPPFFPALPRLEVTASRSQ